MGVSGTVRFPLLRTAIFWASACRPSGAAQELFDGEVNLREELAGIVRAAQPLDVNELVAIPTRPTRDRDSAPVYPPKTPAKC